jgi:hypothetical protein
LIAQQGEPVATVIFEIADPPRRRASGIENHVFTEIDLKRVRGAVDTLGANNKPMVETSVVQLLHCRFASRQIASCKTPGAAVADCFDHPDYGRLTILPKPGRAALAAATGAAG